MKKIFILLALTLLVILTAFIFLSPVNSAINGFFTKLNNQEIKIINLNTPQKNQMPENQSSIPNASEEIPSYFKYLDSSSRKDIICGMATDKHLAEIKNEDLGYSCTISYRQTLNQEKATCRCKPL